MLLVIDIGNTNIVTAIFEGDTIVKEWRMHSDSARTADEYGSMLRLFFAENGISTEKITGGIISSVVPLLIGPFINLTTSIIGKKPILVGPAIYDALPVRVPESAINEIGTDLVANAVQAYTEYKRSCIVADFGTALTFTAINSDGRILGVAITPGVRTAVHSLFANTAQLPSVPLKAPPNTLGTNTIHSIQAGIIIGYKGLVESMITQMKEDMKKENGSKDEDILVIATGGLNSVLQPLTNIFDKIDKSLTLKGLKTIHDILKD
ncbi:MAG: type III pantothenate kinase [Treponemataceae bacterium]|nr:type III pantothenate kinase [Spirochaetales bacterium]MDY6030637.1 type III pantothenate kinase [Treponemataceae bacterium]